VFRPAGKEDLEVIRQQQGPNSDKLYHGSTFPEGRNGDYHEEPTVKTLDMVRDTGSKRREEN